MYFRYCKPFNKQVFYKQCAAYIVGDLLAISLPAALCAAHIGGISVILGGDLEVFAPHGRHVTPMGVKFGVEESTDVDNHTRHSVNTTVEETRSWRHLVNGNDSTSTTVQHTNRLL